MTCDILVIEQAVFINSILISDCVDDVIRGTDILWQHTVIEQSRCLNWYQCNKAVVTLWKVDDMHYSGADF